MMTVNEVSKLSGVSIRSLHHYDKIGLLPATEVTAAGYRLYDDKALERLQMIMLFKELQFPLREIAAILDSPGFDKEKALEQQIHLLELRRDYLENLIDLAREIKKIGVIKMSKVSFDAFDTKKMDDYAKKAKETWGDTSAYKEYEQKSACRGSEEEKLISAGLMDIFVEFGRIKESGPASEGARDLVKKLQAYISKHYYTCTVEILGSLGQMYACGGEMTANIDRCAGEGTGVFVNKAIEAYLLSK